MFNALISHLAVFPKSCEQTFFGFKTWYHYLDGNSSCEVKSFHVLASPDHPSDIPLVLLAIIDDLLRLASLAAVFFVIYGAVQFVTSQGSPDATNRARSTVINALVGLALALISIAIVSFIGNKVG